MSAIDSVFPSVADIFARVAPVFAPVSNIFDAIGNRTPLDHGSLGHHGGEHGDSEHSCNHRSGERHGEPPCVSFCIVGQGPAREGDTAVHRKSFRGSSAGVIIWA